MSMWPDQIPLRQWCRPELGIKSRFTKLSKYSLRTMLMYECKTSDKNNGKYHWPISTTLFCLLCHCNSIVKKCFIKDCRYQNLQFILFWDQKVWLFFFGWVFNPDRTKIIGHSKTVYLLTTFTYLMSFLWGTILVSHYSVIW